MSRPSESLADPRLWLAFATMLLVSGSVIWFVAAALGPVAGWFVARGNPRLVVMTGLGSAAGGILLGAHAPSLAVMIASVGIAVGVGLGLTGFSMLAAGGVLAASGRVLAGLVADRFGAAVAGLASFSASTAGVLCLLAMEAWTSRVFAYGPVLFLFLPLGSRATIVSVLLGRIAGPRNYGPLFGLLGIGNSLGSAAGPWLSGAIFDRTHSYLALYLTTFGFALGIGALVVFLLTARESS